MSDTGRVSSKYQGLDGNQIYVSYAPSGQDWSVMAQNANYLNGHGNQLIPFTMLSGVNWTFKNQITTTIPVFPRPQAMDRYWYVNVESVSAVGVFTMKIGNTAAKSEIVGLEPRTITFRESNITGTVGQSISAISFSASCTVSASILSIGCYEAPRAMLQSGSPDYGVNDNSLRVRKPIYQDAISPERDSVKALATAVSGALNSARTAGIYFWAHPHRENNVATVGFTASAGTAGHWLSPYSASVRIRPVYSTIEGGKFHPASASVASFAILAQGTNALTTGTLHIQTFAGRQTHVFRIGTTVQLFTGTFAIRCDGSSSLGYLPPGLANADRLGFQLQASGSGDFRIYSILVGER